MFMDIYLYKYILYTFMDIYLYKYIHAQNSSKKINGMQLAQSSP